MGNLFINRTSKAIAFFSLFTLTFVSCIKDKSDNIQSFEYDFNQKIDSLKCIIPSGELNYKAWALSGYFYNLTNHSPTAEDRFVYFRIDDRKDSINYNIDNFEKDKKFWKKWLKENKNKYSYTYSDSLYKELLIYFKNKPPRESYEY